MSSHCKRWVWVVVVGMWACGDTTVEPQNRKTAAERDIGGYTREQVEIVCGLHADAVETLAGARGFCLRQALKTADSASQCKRMLSECIPERSIERDPCVDGALNGDHVLAGLLSPQAGTGAPTDPLTGCDVPAFQVENCIERLADIVERATCEDVDRGLELPACLDVIDGRCPGLLTVENDAPGEAAARDALEAMRRAETAARDAQDEAVADETNQDTGRGNGRSESQCGELFGERACDSCLQDVCCDQTARCEDDDDCLCAIECAAAGIEGERRCARVCNIDALPETFFELRDCLEVRCGDECT